MVLDNSVRISRAPTYSGSASSLSTISDTGVSPSSLRLPLRFSYHVKSTLSAALYPHLLFGLGSSAFARRYLRNRSYFLLLQVLRCFSSLRLASSDYLFIRRYHSSRNDGFPHSDIDGSLPAYCSPSRFAVRCVLLRLLVPRHPPYALSCLA